MRSSSPSVPHRELPAHQRLAGRAASGGEISRWRKGAQTRKWPLQAWFGDRIPVALEPNLGTVSTMPPHGYKPAYAGAYGGDPDQRHVQAGSRLHLPVLMPGAGVFFADPHAAIKDGIVSGTGIECAVTLEARIELAKGRKIARPLIERADSIQIVGFGETVEAATEDATHHAVDFLARTTELDREEAYMLLGVIGDLRVGTSPRPVMAARLIIPRAPLAAAGWTGEMA